MDDDGIRTMKLVKTFLIHSQTKKEMEHHALPKPAILGILHRSSRQRLNLELPLHSCLFLRGSQEAGWQEPSLRLWKGECAASSREKNAAREKRSKETQEGWADFQRRKWIYSIESFRKSEFGYLSPARLPLFYMHGKNSNTEIISSNYKTYG